jgi:hypothetical protein
MNFGGAFKLAVTECFFLPFTKDLQHVRSSPRELVSFWCSVPTSEIYVRVHTNISNRKLGQCALVLLLAKQRSFSLAVRRECAMQCLMLE